MSAVYRITENSIWRRCKWSDHQIEADFKSLCGKMESELWVYSYTLGKGRLEFEYFFFVAMDALTGGGCISNHAAKEYPILWQLFWKNNLFPYIFLYCFGAILLVTREPPPPYCSKLLAMTGAIKTNVLRKILFTNVLQWLMLIG